MSLLSNRTTGFIQLCLVIVFIAASFLISMMLQSKKAEPTTKDTSSERALFVETTSVTQQPHRITFETTGIVEALTEISIVPQVSGRVEDVNPSFFEGGFFAKDETLFTIDPRDFELEVERLAAEVTRANTALQLEQAESKAALAEWRQRNGKKPAPDLVARTPQMEQAQADVRAAIAQLNNAKLDLERATFSFPFSGRVMNSTVAVGRYVASGQGYGDVFDLDTLEVRASLEPEKLDWLSSSDDTKIVIAISHNGQTKKYDATLNRGASFYDPSTRFATVSFGLINAVDILPGSFATITVQGPMLDNVTLIPSTAIQKGNSIWAVNDGQLSQLSFETIYTNDDYIAVRGINQTTTIVTSRLDGGSDGMQVNVIEAEDTQ
jgi:RND family efflux transporter MFP subunit